MFVTNQMGDEVIVAVHSVESDQESPVILSILLCSRKNSLAIWDS